jgi:hypothetical protein
MPQCCGLRSTEPSANYWLKIYEIPSMIRRTITRTFALFVPPQYRFQDEKTTKKIYSC